MTYENCLKYFEEATNDEDKAFWEARLKRKYPDKIKKAAEEIEEEVKKPKPKKEKKVDGNN